MNAIEKYLFGFVKGHPSTPKTPQLQRLPLSHEGSGLGTRVDDLGRYRVSLRKDVFGIGIQKIYGVYIYIRSRKVSLIPENPTPMLGKPCAVNKRDVSENIVDRLPSSLLSQ